MMRIFVDANVLVSAAWSAESKLCRLWQVPDSVVVTVEIAATDAQRAIETKSRDADREIRVRRLLDLIRMTEMVRIPPGAVMLNTWGIADPDDVAIIWAAVSSRCQMLITGDTDFLEYFDTERDGVRVLRPADALRVLRAV